MTNASTDMHETNYIFDVTSTQLMQVEGGSC